MSGPESDGRRPLRPGLIRLLALAVIPAATLLLVVAIIAVVRELDTGSIFRDPAQLLDVHPLLGGMSSLGIILWWITAATCFFSFALSRRFGLSRGIQLFLITSALLTTILAIDDQFLIHDVLASEYLGLRERHVMLVYLVLIGGYLVVNLSTIRRSEWVILLASLSFFAGSVATDYIEQATMTDVASLGAGLDWGLFLEDGLKFLGIAAWSTYLMRFSYAILANSLTWDPPDDIPRPA